ncbi:MAG TPA: pilus assembly protein PilB, partial [bacterium]|nr:pilus assembly protein PilB [bacterium]
IIDSKIREMILQKRSADDIRKYCITNGVSFLKDAALELLKNGEISVDEIISLLSVENEI